jgi:TonB family protein
MRPRIQSLVTILVVMLAPEALAQASASQSDTSIVPWSALSARPRLLDTTNAGGIRYPSLLFDANVEGVVRLETIVDRNGAIESAPMRIASSTHELFTSAARSGVSRWRFSPAVVDSRNVRTAVPITVTFVLPKEPAAPWREVSTVAVDASGVHVAIGTEAIPRDSSIAPNPADVREATIAALSELVPLKSAAVDGAVCVVWTGPSRNVPPDVLVRLRKRYPPLRNADRCPPTYQSQILRVDSLGNPIKRPPGAIDPTRIDVSPAEIWTRDYYVVHGRVGRGTMSAIYKCVAHRERDNEWKATCVRTGTSVA